MLLFITLTVTAIVEGADTDTFNTEVNLQHRYFADELTQRLYPTMPFENEFTSAWSISLALALLYPAAVGLSYEQLQDVVRLPDITSTATTSPSEKLVWNETTTRLQSTYDGECLYMESLPNTAGEMVETCVDRNPQLVVAYKVYVDDQMMLEPSYAQAVQGYVEMIDFDADSAGATINSWVNKTTEGKIPSIVMDGPHASFDAAIVNAIYLKARWMDEFLPRNTGLDEFYSDSSRNTVTNAQAHFMHAVRFNQHYSDTAILGYQVLQLFLGGNLSVIFALALPTKSGEGLISSVDVLAAVPLLDRRRVAMAIPKFQFESTYENDLKESLIDMNLSEPFNTECNSLCVFDATNCLTYISTIIHKTFIDLNEEGIEAAAVTFLGLAGSSMPLPEVPVLFVADHPFQFFIYDSYEELVLFEGLVSDPSVSVDTPTPTLQLSHNDPNFWFDRFYLSVEEAPQEIGGSSAMNMGPTAAPTTEPTAAPTAARNVAPTAAPTTTPIAAPTAPPTDPGTTAPPSAAPLTSIAMVILAIVLPLLQVLGI